MIIDEIFLESLLEKATEIDRRRANYDLRTSGNDGSQRMLNMLLPGTQVPVHRHRNTTETVVVLSGRLTEVIFNDKGEETARYDLCPAEGRFGCQVPKGAWHTVIVEEPCVIFEAKDGAYEPLTDEDVMNTETLNERAQLIESLRNAIKTCDTKVIIALISGLYTERYAQDTEVMDLYRQAFNQLSE